MEASIQKATGQGQSLPDDVRSSMEGAFGADFSGVRLHTGAESDALNESMSARAFTSGSDIFLRQGEYNPGSASGKQLLAHELTHVVQQGGAGAPDLSRLFAPGPAVQRIVVTIGTEKVDVHEADGKITKKGKKEQKEAEKIIKSIKKTYGIDISSPKLIEGIKDQYTGVPNEVTDSLETREWKMIELRSIAKALANFAPILGKARAGSTRKDDDQEVTAFGKAKNAIDLNTPAGKLDVTTLGEFFKGKKVMGTFKSSEGATPDFPDEGDQLVGTFVHETAHRLLSYAYDDFV